MNAFRSTVLAAACVLAGAAPLPAAADGAPVRQAVEALDARWDDALNHGDAQALAALYAPDARVVAPRAEPLAGREAIRGYFAAVAARGVGNHRITVEEVRAHGDDLATQVASWRSNGPAPAAGGEHPTYQGHLVTVLRRQPDGAWAIHLHTWN